MIKLLALLIFLSGCASSRPVSDIRACIAEQTLMYADICAESSDPHTYQNGVKCGAESVAYCLGVTP